MCKFIGIEDLVANALIELLEKNNCRRVSFETLLKYGAVVLNVLRDKGDEAIFLLSKEHTNELIRNYSDYFEIDRSEIDSDAIVLKEGKTVDDLRDRFRAFLTVDRLLAFTDDKSLAELGVAV
ncbi:MAG: hypothetical protein FWE24_09510 [Defluviitaleaceae bacterium]|nr:hypothetical protein [Defluviitaleaceae bacterium]